MGVQQIAAPVVSLLDPPEQHQTGVGMEWITLALTVEERQYIFFLFLQTLLLHWSPNRLELQDIVKRLEKEPQEDVKKEVELKRNLLSGEFELLDGLKHRAVSTMKQLISTT